MRRPFLNMTPLRAQYVREAITLLREEAPEYYDHFCRVITSVVYAPGVCGRGLACTGGPLRRTAVLAVDPEETDIVEIAALLTHEALHHRVDSMGRVWSVPHRCRGCTTAWEQATDPIYRRTALLRQRLNSSQWRLLAPYLW